MKKLLLLLSLSVFTFGASCTDEIKVIEPKVSIDEFMKNYKSDKEIAFIPLPDSELGSGCSKPENFELSEIKDKPWSKWNSKPEPIMTTTR